MRRGSGVLMHISSLYGDYSIGSFGDEARHFVDFLHDCGFSYWQVLPLGMTDECNSPYKSYSAFGGNPYFIDLKQLYLQELITKDELEAAKQKTPFICEYDFLSETRLDILRKASQRVKNVYEITDFINNRKYLKQLCFFMALKQRNFGLPWNEWISRIGDDDTYFLHCFIQYEFFIQWQNLKQYANEKGIKIIGDIPIYVDYDSSDVWGNKQFFALDKNMCPSCVAGVPPDYFCEDGQLWGNPLYEWDEMQRDGFSWWVDRISHMLSMFDGVRIDHFRGLLSYWSVPAGSETAKNGKWIEGPGEKLVDAIKKAAGDKLIIAEDLGDITEDVVKLVKYSDFPGMRVLQFGFLHDGDNPHMPHNYPENCVSYTGTHDNNTLLGYVWELDERMRKYMFEYCGYKGNAWSEGCEHIIRAMFSSHSDTLILPIQDLLLYGADTRLNTPGVAKGNWQFRITKEQLDSINKEKFKRLNLLYKR